VIQQCESQWNDRQSGPKHQSIKKGGIEKRVLLKNNGELPGIRGYLGLWIAKGDKNERRQPTHTQEVQGPETIKVF
jgi:hypothetical protein